MIASLLIANRGEIACRIIRTARRMGIRTVAVYSDADAKALHVREADEAVHIGPSPAAESYLVGDKIIAAAKDSAAEAIHPGYGFLSENADFAAAVIDAGLVWVGPRPESIRAMGLKDTAKKLMDEAGVPVTPGYLGEDQSEKRLAEEAEKIGYPVLIKAVAGGGGKGMRKVDDPANFADALQSCRREATAAFGNDHVLLEKWIESPRHIEVQIFGDSHGNVVHLFERDCSLQRRHQKVIEEAPAPGMDEATREAVCGAAVRAAKAVDYEGAGTVEFIADASEGLRADRVWFMEMNTRLQVEHPVTEEITGQDLVEWQLRVASGEDLPCRQDQLAINGHAIEARVYAEDPANGFLPSTGRLDIFSYFGGKLRHYHNDRQDSGVEQGDSVSPHYDPMIAKLVEHADSRERAIDNLIEACRTVRIHPVRTNAGFLAELLDQDAFRSGSITTGFIGSLQSDFFEKPEIAEDVLGEIALWMSAEWGWPGPSGFDLDLAITGFRLNQERRQDVVFWVDKKLKTARLPQNASSEDFIGDKAFVMDGEGAVAFSDGYSYEVRLRPIGGAAAGAASDGAILSPMPGKIIAVSVGEGDVVAKGDKLLTLEAMKMEHTLVAPFDGTVAELDAQEGGQVSEGALLARIEAPVSD
ncbi:MAG: biotin carboxylase N-terminal domain-containing protein [Parasphingopyxis sp.]